MAHYRIYLSILTLSAFVLGFSSCKEDEDPVIPKISFASSEITVNEADGVIQIEILLDNPAPEDFTLEYSLKGSANEEVAVGNTASPDYKVNGDYLEVEVLQGATNAIIELELYSDLELEDDETIEVSIESVDSERVELTRDDETEITIVQEDGLFVILEWGINQGENYTDVDMDLFLWAENASNQLVLTNISSARASFTSPEFFMLPTAGLDDGNYGLSCNYYAGTKEPMNFQVRCIKVVNNADAGTVSKTASYTLANVNAWDETDVDPLLALTFVKAGTDFTSFSEITVAGNGSRQSSGRPADLKRVIGASPEQVPVLLKKLIKK